MEFFARNSGELGFFDVTDVQGLRQALHAATSTPAS
jgi:hypothetical protein